jgi:hypothetical protein
MSSKFSLLPLWTGLSGASPFAVLLAIFGIAHGIAANCGWAKSQVTESGRRTINKTLLTAIEADEMISHVDLRCGVVSLNRLKRHQRRSKPLV